jgi:CheY-like chemotaxis protein
MPPSTRQRRPWIYVADDDESMRELVLSTLAAAGYQVLQAADGQELLDGLLDRARLEVPTALVISDVAMPRLTGPAACAAARAAGVATPFIFMTAFASSGALEVAARASAVAVLDKPFDMAELLTAVRHVLSRAEGR